MVPDTFFCIKGKIDERPENTC
jgi:hypothetical protein